jgi:peptidoglycan hydrolase CwlO-like protein
MDKKKLTILLTTAGIIIAALLIGLIIFMNKSSKQSEQIAQTELFMEEEKQQMVTEIETLAGEMDGFTLYVHNDSLLRQFDMQKQKIKELQDELKRTKATDAKRIAELKDEIATLRKILAHYVQQIDSLNSLNQRLTTENLEVKQRYQSVSATAELLAKEKETLNEAVSRAAVLEAHSISVTPLDDRERKTERASRMRTLKFNYTIGKNITAEPGPKTIYLRLTRPDEELMTKSGGTFPYENKEIAYSLRKEIEYGGEAYSDVMYWKVDEILQLGTYRIDIFADGNRIGSKSFRIERN